MFIKKRTLLFSLLIISCNYIWASEEAKPKKEREEKHEKQNITTNTQITTSTIKYPIYWLDRRVELSTSSVMHIVCLDSWFNQPKFDIKQLENLPLTFPKKVINEDNFGDAIYTTLTDCTDVEIYCFYYYRTINKPENYTLCFHNNQCSARHRENPETRLFHNYTYRSIANTQITQAMFFLLDARVTEKQYAREREKKEKKLAKH